jgi:hypothetical protein
MLGLSTWTQFDVLIWASQILAEQSVRGLILPTSIPRELWDPLEMCLSKTILSCRPCIRM